MTLILTQFGYVFDEQQSIWTRANFNGIAYSDGDEVEQRIARVVAEATDISVLSSELRQHCTDWPSIYHLSGTRANILRPFEPDLCGDVLEIGAGCGAITRYLGECGGNVLALEGSPRRAVIARSRTRDLQNVSLVSDNFNDFTCNKKFDVVTLIGVLEYASLFTNSETPALSMLERARSFLKPDGKLIIAIENQLGLKYFAGAPEDHVGVAMYGIEGRYRSDQPQTFGRTELSSLITRAGFANSEFLAPFPDYKFPTSIISARGLSCDQFDAAALAWQSVRRDPQLPKVMTFSPELVWPAIVKNNLTLDFANSFLVVASSEKSQSLVASNTLAWHFTTERKKDFCKAAEFVLKETNQIKVLYKRLAPIASNPIVGALLQYHVPVQADYRSGRVLSHDLMRIATRDGWRIEEICTLLRQWLNFVASAGTERGLGINLNEPSSKLPPSAFDCIPQNVVISAEGEIFFIDSEWSATESLEVGFVTYRSILALLGTHTRFGQPAVGVHIRYWEFLLDVLNGMGWNISEDELERYVELESRMQAEVQGRKVDANEVTQWLKDSLLPVNNLSQTVTKYEGQIISLNHAVAERDGQVSSLTQSVAERDGQVSSLTQSVAERDGQVSSLTQSVAERDGQISSLNHAVAERDGQIFSLNHAVAERERKIAGLEEETVRRGEWALGLNRELLEERAKVLELTSSNSWRITRPLREARRWFSAPKTQAKRYVKGALSYAKRIYQSLPISYQTKAKHRRLIAKFYPRILLASGANPSSIPAFNIPRPLVDNLNHQNISVALEDPAAFAAEILIPAVTDPLVSVIIPVYGKVTYTLRCLASIAAHTPEAKIEVIVVDDCSPDSSWEILKKVRGIRLLRNEQNEGFIRSCNLGAQAAKGEFLYYLNNDTEVTPGWADALLRTFAEFPGTGLAGSKLIYPDGRLQEAGGIIWQDGSAWNFGRFQDPTLPVYNYAREVDYCSGASIMVPQSLFHELGGFDEHYLPAYCEDSDLALKIRDKGYRVIYQPMSTVIHYEGITSGTDLTQGTKAYQVTNTKKMYERWKGRLQRHQLPGVDVDKAKDRRATRRVLVLDHCTPTPDQDAGSVIMFNVLSLLREMDFQVTFIPENNFIYMPKYTSNLQRRGIEMLYAPHVNSVAQHLRECGSRYDLVFLSRPGVVDLHIRSVRAHCPKAKVLYHTQDLHFLRLSREADLFGDNELRKAAQEMKHRELAGICAADAAIVVSTVEIELLRPLIPEASLHLFPLILDVKGTNRTFNERRDIVFVGGYQHEPNVDAVQYFVSQIMPKLRELLPGIRFYVVGSKPPPAIQALAAEDVVITGFVEDLTPLLDKMRVLVSPLRYGAGIKGKIGTAMAVGLPVVATPLAAEGMLLSDGENILIADRPEEFAKTVCRLYQDESLWARISDNGVEFAEKAWGAEAGWNNLANILASLGLTVRGTGHRLSIY